VRKLTAGVVTGLVLGAVQGAVTEGEPAGAFGVFLAALARGSQGVVNGILASYLTRPAAPLWIGGAVGAGIGALLGALAGISSQTWATTVPWSAVVGAGCGVATAKAGR
jgi:hypothetical protein